MPEERRQVTLSKTHRATPVGRELIDLCVELSADGVISRDELNRLRGWLEIDHGVDVPALPFLHENLISSPSRSSGSFQRTFVSRQSPSGNKSARCDASLNARTSVRP
jgi:hypothetical protein